jgi:2-keto-4-pentenoate hydratase/2-oxohepta-3-ene-1,7-dioic acid hydratase in catechol pathway/sugar lactone lactonase YvrE
VRLRLVRTVSGGRSVAVWQRASWVPLTGVDPTGRLGAAAHDVMAFLAGGRQVRDLAREVLDGSDTASLGPVDPERGLPFRPSSFRDCSLWEQHQVAAARGLLHLNGGTASRAVTVYERLRQQPFPRLRPRPLWHEQPLYYKGASAAWLADGDTARWPYYTQALDYELEIALVISRAATDLTAADAPAVIGGFVLVNDLSARDVQWREMVEGRMGPAKSKDFGTAVGPVVVTADELLSQLDDLHVEVRVNDEIAATGSTRGMRHSVADVVAYASAGEPVQAGDLIGLGTVPGCSALESGHWISPGDEIALGAGPLGVLRTRIGRPDPWPSPGPVTRPRWSVVSRSGEEPDPATVRPERWRPPAAPTLTGAFTPNEVLDTVERLEVPGGVKPEDVVLDEQGRLYSGVEDGRIYRWSHPGTDVGPELFADTHGRPLGLELDPRDGSLLVCDGYRGLLRVTDAGDVVVLADSYRGRRLRCPNNAAVAADGTVYFSDSSTRFRIEHYKHDLLEHRPNGRIFAYRPGADELTLIADGLYFPNGVALTPDDSALLVVETGTYTLSRIELTGTSAGRRQTLAANLPGLPDNLSAVGDDTYWIALPSLRIPALDRMLPLPLVRSLTARLPARLQPVPPRYGSVLQVDGTGRILRSLHGPAGRYAEITGVREHDGWLYLGSLLESAAARVRLPQLACGPKPGVGERSRD